MAIPVFFTAELMPFQDMAGNAVDEAIAALSGELKSFFTDKADFIINEGSGSVVGLTYDASAENPELAVVIATLAAGFRGISEQEALSIAQTFKSATFPHVTASTDQASIVTHPTGKGDAAPAPASSDA
ncbi:MULTISPECIES: hypothetical protein [Mycobacterium avium complex (MAC)]|nr:MULTISPECIES: hypothetical protein [Mycobacterium avium complex (MAC)]AOS94936.1 hypothetical protein AN480_28250 [Mycobacterium intracellulare subsp. chimaera]PBA69075.1 hypothetical protein CKJ76_24850 [Mycobacterium avium]